MIERSAVSRRVGVAMGLIFIALLPSGIYAVDGRSMYAVAWSIAGWDGLDVAPSLGVAGRGGDVFSIWYPLLSALAVPFAIGGRLIGSVFDVDGYYVGGALATAISAAASAVAAGYTAAIALRIGATVRRAVVVATVLCFGTAAFVYARTFFADSLLMALAAVSVYHIDRSAPSSIRSVGLVAVALAPLAKPVGVVVAIAIGIDAALTRSWRRAVLIGGAALTGLLVYAAYNLVRFGSALDFGERAPFGLAALPEGVLGLLASPGRGLIWYCAPVVMLVGLRHPRPQVLRVGLLLLAGLVLVHAARPIDWYGGNSWGPRFLLPALPPLLACAVALPRAWWRMFVALALVIFLLQAPLAWTSFERYPAEQRDAGLTEDDLLWSPTRAPLLHVWGPSIRQVDDAFDLGPLEAVEDAGGGSTSVASSRYLRSIASWWWFLPAVGPPAVAGLVAALVLLSVGVGMLVRLAQREVLA